MLGGVALSWLEAAFRQVLAGRRAPTRIVNRPRRRAPVDPTLVIRSWGRLAAAAPLRSTGTGRPGKLLRVVD
jgi:hypothetical protein